MATTRVGQPSRPHNLSGNASNVTRGRSIFPRFTIALETVTDLLGLLLAALLAYYGTLAVIEAHVNTMVQYKTWHVPESILLSAVPVCGVLFGIESLLRILRVSDVLQDQNAAVPQDGR